MMSYNREGLVKRFVIALALEDCSLILWVIGFLRLVRGWRSRWRNKNRKSARKVSLVLFFSDH
jgi:hypothetical protein